MRSVRSSRVLSLIGSTALIRNGSMMVLNTGSSKMSLPRLAPFGSPDPGPRSAAAADARRFLTEASRLPDRKRDRDVHVPARIDGSRSRNHQFVAEGYRRYSVVPGREIHRELAVGAGLHLLHTRRSSTLPTHLIPLPRSAGTRAPQPHSGRPPRGATDGRSPRRRLCSNLGSGSGTRPWRPAWPHRTSRTSGESAQ